MEMKKIVAFGASNSKESINKKFAAYAASQIKESEITLLDLNDFEMPIFSIERENEIGFPTLAQKFRDQLNTADGIIISFAEHNGAYSTAFKNIFDWISRGGPNIWGNKPMFLLSTSPGGMGGKTVLEIAVGKISRMNENEIVHFSLPNFDENFDNQITDSKLNEEFNLKLSEFTSNLG